MRAPVLRQHPAWLPTSAARFAAAGVLLLTVALPIAMFGLTVTSRQYARWDWVRGTGGVALLVLGGSFVVAVQIVAIRDVVAARAPRVGGGVLAAMAVAIAVSNLAFGWTHTHVWATVTTTALFVLRGRTATVVVGAVIAFVTVIVPLLDYEDASLVGRASYLVAAVLWRTVVVYTLVRLVADLRQLAVVRRRLAEQATMRQRTVAEVELADAVGRSMLGIIEASTAAGRAKHRPDAAVWFARSGDLARDALASARALVSRYRDGDAGDDRGNVGAAHPTAAADGPARAWSTWQITHAAAAAFWVVQAVLGAPVTSAVRNPLVAAVLVAGVSGLQLRHTFAALRGDRPRLWPGTLAVLLVLCVAPVFWVGQLWSTVIWAAIGSSLMLLPRRLAVAVGLVAFAAVWTEAVVLPYADSISTALLLTNGVYSFVIAFGGGLALWASVELSRVREQLDATNRSIEELAITRERLRQAADVHDLLGQDLTAISLRSSLGRRLAASNAPGAPDEARAITELAVKTLSGLRSVVRDVHDISLATEIDAGRALLRAASIDVRVDGVASDPPRAVESVLAWCAREAVTNVVRHSEATWCAIDIRVDAGRLVMSIANDGARESIAPGNGLRGMSQRAAGVGGSATWTMLDGTCTVTIRVPVTHDDEHHGQAMTVVTGAIDETTGRLGTMSSRGLR